MADAIIEVKGAQYSIGKLPPYEQFHVTRRLGPLVATAGLSFAAVRKAIKEGDTDSIMVMVGPAATILAAMPQEDADYVLNTMLSVVRRKQGDSWAPVSAGGNRLMFEDIDMLGMIRLAVEVGRINMKDFFSELLDNAP